MLNSGIEFLNSQPMIGLFLVIALGTLLGRGSVKGITLGSSGVLLLALLFGHLGMELPEVVVPMGVILFVYAVGLQAGPRFLRSFRLHGLEFTLIVLATLSTAFICCLLMAHFLNLPPNLSAGLFAGALTSTPALAASLDLLADPSVAVGFGVAYPFGVLGVILFVQLVPRFLKVDMSAEEDRIRISTDGDHVINGWFRIENAQLVGHTVDQVSSAHLTDTQISRVSKQGEVFAAKGDLVLALGDHVRAVGTESELKRLEWLMGPRVADIEEKRSHVSTMTLNVTERKLSGKSLAELNFRERFGVNITRIYRDDFEFVPHGFSRLEFGDTIRIAGASADCQQVQAMVGHQEEKLQETQFLPLALGLVAGVILGLLPLPVPGGMQLKLGLAGGPLLAGLIVGHFGRIGPLSFRIPRAALFFIRELGLLFFLAGAGVSAGQEFWAVMQAEGLAPIVIAVVATWAPMFVAYFFARTVLHLDVLTVLGAICGAMTSTPGLGAVTKMSRTPVASLAYVSVYPAALIGTTVLGPAIGILLATWLRAA